MPRTLLIAALLMVTACAGQSPYDFPMPIVMPDGSRGFGMTGYAQFTDSEEKAKAEITQHFVDACKGKVKITQLQMWRADSLGGLPHIGYNATAKCL